MRPTGETEPAVGERCDWQEFWTDHSNCGGTWVYVKDPAVPRVICSCAMTNGSETMSVLMQQKAKDLVYSVASSRLDKTDATTFTVDEVYVVWFCKTLQNWKALLSTTLPDGMYYEVTYDGDKKKTYVDSYKKFDNQEFSDPV